LQLNIQYYIVVERKMKMKVLVDSRKTPSLKGNITEPYICLQRKGKDSSFTGLQQNNTGDIWALNNARADITCDFERFRENSENSQRIQKDIYWFAIASIVLEGARLAALGEAAMRSGVCNGGSAFASVANIALSYWRYCFANY
jgi:hypothetical protein